MAYMDPDAKKAIKLNHLLTHSWNCYAGTLSFDVVTIIQKDNAYGGNTHMWPHSSFQPRRAQLVHDCWTPWTPY